MAVPNLRVTEELVEVAEQYVPDPHLRVTQQILEIAEVAPNFPTLKVTQELVEIAQPGPAPQAHITQQIIESTSQFEETPLDMRVSQAVTETSVVPDLAQVRASQGVIEVNKLPSTAKIRATQGVIEINKLPSTAKIRITQAVIELLRANTPPAPQGIRSEYIHRRHFPGN
jgi:hypothetical protein